MKLKAIFIFSVLHSTIPQPSVRFASRRTPNYPVFLPKSIMTLFPILGITVSRQVWSISMEAVPIEIWATYGSTILLILHFLLWKAGSISCGFILTVMPGRIHSTSSSSGSSPSFCFFNSSYNFSILFIFLRQMGSSLTSLSNSSTVQKAERLLSVLKLSILIYSLSGITICFLSSYKRASYRLSSFSRLSANSRSFSILVCRDLSSCYFYFSLQFYNFSFLAASMKSRVLFTMQTTLQLGGVPITCRFLTF